MKSTDFVIIYQMEDSDLCGLADTITDYYVVPFLAAIIFLFMVHPVTVKWLERYIPCGFWTYFFGAVIVFFVVFLAEIVIKQWRETRSDDCIDRGTL